MVCTISFNLATDFAQFLPPQFFPSTVIPAGELSHDLHKLTFLELTGSYNTSTMKPLALKPRRAISAYPPRRSESAAQPEDFEHSEVNTEDSPTNSLRESCQIGPMSRLPAELLAQVFEHCLSSDVFPVPASSQAPLLLAHTCSRWRAVALSTPSLWSRLHIIYRDPSLDIPMASDWLRRSGCLPLSISISIDFNEQPAQEILDVVCSHSPRWRHIRFEFRGLYCPPMYSLSLAENNTPLLRAFDFDARDISSANITPIISLLSAAPELREVTWVDDLADTRRLMELPLSRLTLLSITMTHGTLDYLELLDQCYNLEHIRITRPRPGDTRLPREPLVLSKLTSLNIAYDLTAILDSLVLPALKHVRIHSEGQTGRSTGRSIGAGGGVTEGVGSGIWSPVSFLSLVERSSCTIESLWLDTPMTETCLAECLEMTTSSLTKLTVAGVLVTDKLLSSLTCSPVSPLLSVPSSSHPSSSGSSPLCPSLQEISLNTRISSSPGILLQMAQSRLIPKPDMENDIFYLRIWDGHKDLQSLVSLREEHCSPSSTCNFKLGVLVPPRNAFSGLSGFPSRLRPRRHLSGKRRTCQSR
ncbi:hypothetical protein D9756_003381 [Leucocoprinus leucothites]|uniref:F-box domain-containing protein n=1 Tax=Leucocoprinus leucothites TaxID=201217 RepID=A0A8H5G735_9AGAR|nr:hypothetical protein D9756_003381 [Leucoagaricus leucothites]